MAQINVKSKSRQELKNEDKEAGRSTSTSNMRRLVDLTILFSLASYHTVYSFSSFYKCSLEESGVGGWRGISDVMLYVIFK